MSKNLTPAAPKSAAVRVNPGSGTDLIDSNDYDQGGLDKSIVLEGDMTIEELRDSLNTNVAPDVNAGDFKQYAGNLEFMEERVLVRVMPSAEKHAEKVIDVYNNGTIQCFIRGEWVIAKRKFVEVLARAKPFGVQTNEITDGNGDRATRIDTNTGMRYPFEMKDKNPRGQGWLQSILQEA